MQEDASVRATIPSVLIK